MTYINPWAKDHDPKEYTRNVTTIDYNGCHIVKVHQFQYDIVKNGLCIGQRCGMEGAKMCADIVSDMMFPTFEDVRERMLAKYGQY